MSEDREQFYLDEEVSTLEYALRRWWPLCWHAKRGRWQVVFRPIHWHRPKRYVWPAAYRDYGWDTPVCTSWAAGPLQLNRFERE